MRILVTGGAGFIGSHLARHLLSQGHEVGIIDRRKDWHLAPANCRWFETACQPYPAWVVREDWDFCYHLASTVGVANVLANPQECIENIIESTRAMLTLGIPGMYFSTSEVYGKNTSPLTEDANCVLSGKSRWSYAAAKLCGEWLALAAGWKVVRLFNVIGPNQNPAYGAVVPKFIDCAKKNLPIPVYGDGLQRRTFTSVFDVVQVLDILRDKKFDVVNVGSSNTVTILELARTIRRLMGVYKVQMIDKKNPSQSQIVLRPYAEAYADGFEECPSRVPYLGKMYGLIGAYKFKSLGEMLTEVINEQQGHVKTNAADLQRAAVCQ